MECHERYFMIAVDLSFTGEELRFEAVGKYETNRKCDVVLFCCFKYNVYLLLDENNVYPVTEQYGAQNGYTVQVLPLQGLVELRASYFSPHTKNKVCTNLKMCVSSGCISAVPCKYYFLMLFTWVLSG